MPRYIDAEDLVKRMEPQNMLDANDIAEFPTADVVPVVRCRDCEAYQPTEGGKPFCVVHERATFSDSFCSEGERREET